MFPHLPNGLGLSADPTLIIFQAGFEQVQIQVLKRGHIWDGHEKISATKPNRCLDPTFLPPSGWLAEMAVEQVIRAKGDELLVLLASFSLRHQANSGRKVIIADPPGHAPEVSERTHMTIEEALLLLAGKRHHVPASAMRQPHHKDLDCLTHSGDDHDCFPPIHLGVSARFKGQRQEEGWGFVVFVPLGKVQAHS